MCISLFTIAFGLGIMGSVLAVLNATERSAAALRPARPFRGEPALVHAQLCLDTCVEHGIGDFDIAYAHEAMARAYRVLGDPVESAAHAEQARRATAGIADAEDREHAMEDIAELL